MTENQARYIQVLIDQIGYRASPHRKLYSKTLGVDDRSGKKVSRKIDFLIECIYARTYASKKEISIYKDYSIRDLMQFTFCPASFAIKESYAFRRPLGQYYDDNIPTKSYLLERLADLEGIKYLKESALKERWISLYETQKMDFDSYFGAKLIYNGYDTHADPKNFNTIFLSTCRPQLVFQTKYGIRKLVVEKVYPEENLPEWPERYYSVDALTQLYLLDHFKCHEAAVITWGLDAESKQSLDRKYTIHQLPKAEGNKLVVLQALTNFQKFLVDKTMSFGPDDIIPQNCFKCTCLAICNHKTGFVSGLSLQYSTAEMERQFPIELPRNEQLKALLRQIELDDEDSKDET